MGSWFSQNSSEQVFTASKDLNRAVTEHICDFSRPFVHVKKSNYDYKNN